MAQTACPCSECIQSLKQQVSVMRKEIRNIRQHADSAVRAHRKQMASLQSVLADGWSPGPRPSRDPGGARASLERGHVQTVPVGYISSCFANKSGTPRQPGICTSSRASLQLRASVFNNPEHALAGLDQYSHVWLIFLFHKNGHVSYKAKVKPPRLNGQRVGVYSTRSPHRPNALGLTLARLEGIAGDTLHLSGVDLIAGTPVLDIKPYIPEYDSPLTRLNVEPRFQQMDSSGTLDAFNTIEEEPGEGEHVSSSQISAKELSGSASGSEVTGASELSKMLAEVKDYLQQGELFAERRPADRAVITGSEPGQDVPSRVSYGPEAYGRIAAWIRDPPVGSLGVRFTPAAEQELAEFGPPESTDTGRPRFQFLRGPEDAAAAIRALLAADPRSVYRRTRCPDRLFFFTLDTADITCWFGDGFAEVLRVRPACVTLDAAVTPAPPQ
ncbi:tRNA (adenine(37)-N6)-methyltransferase isoform X1 [Electrophorus electricus]|nr:tRNA (adenine(37)-N6)-methyltransferase isoform X1 [Electrophorus electricus]XP_026878560.2 tRNA (adenine(37)-N6)-methyltransferase isoform X1 [Electrophorus electricus]